MAKEKRGFARDQYFGLAALVLAIFLIANDYTAFAPALPSIEREFNVDVTTSQWIINGYALVFGVLIISGGRLADIYGRRNIFMLGAVIFVFFSLLGGLAMDIWMLLVSRALMGVGAALMWPSILGMTYNLVPFEQSGQAGGIIMATCGLANATGPVLGGILADAFSWRWIFFINIFIAILTMLACWWVVPPDRLQRIKEKIDYAGVLLLCISLFCLLFALDISAETGFKHPVVISLVVIFLVFLCLFSVVEYRVGKDALIPPDIANNRKFLAISVTTLLISVVFLSAILYVPQFLANYRGYSAVQAGLSLVPLMVISGVVSFISGRFYETLGPKILVSVGILGMSTGMFMLSHLTEDTGFLQMCPGLVVLGIGIGLFNPSSTTAGITVVESHRASLAGAILYMFKIGGGAVGLGMNATIIAFAPDVPSGIDRAFTVNAYLALAGLIVCLFFVTGRPRDQSGELL
ncbi:MFS transporter [Microbulbifer sp. OS29]|uniref:MFS transporter n=1 Tax=Microbulbifer okhotskensis TaxID=2926617 RepID=A0A9X2ELF8_9GAMM|nr:MFS transporter [Microbulbifer okhotskensis]MCO1334414.1 MFS transporter [Microbulbifer okhotskensis]